MKKFSLLLLAGGLFFVSGCHKKDLSNEKDSKPPVISTSASPITASIQGNVFDENDQPVSGVQISVGSKTATTDSRGYFRIEDASLDKSASLLTGQKAGYFKIVKSFAATSGVNYQRIKLLKKNLVGTITGSEGGTVDFDDGSSVTLPANGVVKESDNSPYTGTVNVYAAVIDPTAPDFPEIIPGSLMANDSKGKRVMLRSYGMLAVTLESPGSEPLQVAPGETATLHFNIPADLQSTAPSSIPLWYINSEGLWQEQGRAYKSGNIYSGEVSHFSFWNCDTAFNTVMLNLTVTDSKDRPVQYASVRLNSEKYGATHGYTDSLGQVSGLVPFNEQVDFSISSAYYCTVNSGSHTIGPFTQSTGLTITADDLSLTTVTGRILNCNDEPSATASALIYYKNNRYMAQADPSGNFSIVLTRCGTGDEAIIIGVDSSGKEQGEPENFSISSSSVEAGDIKACGVSTSEFVNYTLDGVSYSLNNTDENTTFQARDTSGSYQDQTEIAWVFIAENMNLDNRIVFYFKDDEPNQITHLSFAIGNKHFGQSSLGGVGVSLNLTNFPQMVGGYFEGSFEGSFTDRDNQPHQVSCTFRMRRDK